MIAVAALALGMAIAVSALRAVRSRAYHNRALMFASVEKQLASVVSGAHKPRYTLANGEMEIVRQRLAYVTAMRKKYEYAASHPWVSQQPDPPAPK
jgi:hypothetical protein